MHSLAPVETALGGRKVDLMGALMKKIAQDIKIASSICDFYMNKKFLCMSTSLTTSELDIHLLCS